MRVPRPVSIATALSALAVVVAACGGAGGASVISSGAPASASASAPASAPASAAASAPTQPSATPAASSSARAAAPLPTLAPVATIAGFHFPVGLVATSDAVWTLSHEDASLLRIDPATNTITDAIPIGTGSANSLMLIDGKLWANDQGGGRLVEVDPSTKKVVGTVKAGGDGVWVAPGDGAIWVLGTDGSLTHVDPAKRAVVATFPGDSGCTGGLAVGGGWVWVGGPYGAICRFDPTTGKVVAHGSSLVADGAGIAWAGDHLVVPGRDGGVVVVDPTTVTASASFPPPAGGTFDGSRTSLGGPGENVVFVATKDGYWVQYNGATIGHLTPADATHSWTLYAGLPASEDGGLGVLEAFGSLWVANANDAPGATGGGKVIRLTPPRG
jgi:hypothetical protein